MSRTIIRSVVLRTSMSGLTSDLRARLLNADNGQESDSLLSSVFYLDAGSAYVWSGEVADDFSGRVQYYRSSNSEILGSDTIEPASVASFSPEDRAKLNSIISSLTGVNVTVSVPVNKAMEFVLHQGYDYLNEDSLDIRFTVRGVPDLTDATVTLDYNEGGSVLEGVVENPGDTAQVIRFEFSKDFTASLEQGRHPCRISALLQSGDRIYVTTVYMVVQE